jgi:hypothetical protein
MAALGIYESVKTSHSIWIVSMPSVPIVIAAWGRRISLTIVAQVENVRPTLNVPLQKIAVTPEHPRIIGLEMLSLRRHRLDVNFVTNERMGDK